MKSSKTIRFAVILLGIVLSACLIYNYEYVKSVNNGYAALLTKESKEFQSFQSISFQVSNIQRSLLYIAIVEPKEYVKWQGKIIKAQSKIDSQFNNLENLASGPDEIAYVKKLKQSYSEYKDEYLKLLPLLLAEDFEGTNQTEKIKEIGTSYEAYMKQQKNMLTLFRQNVEKQSQDIKDKSLHTSEFLLLVGTLPYLLILITIISSLLVLVWLSTATNGFKVHE